MKRQRVVIVANRAAGRGRRHLLARMADLLRERGAGVEVRWTSSPDAAGVDLTGLGGDEVLVAAGGDGTLHQVANALHRRGIPCPLAFLPLGTANVFAHEARLPTRGSELADLILGGEATAYALGWGRFSGLSGRPEERLFLLMAGVGWDARVTMAVHPGWKNLHGRAAFVLAGLKILLAGAPDRVALLADGREMSGEALVVANSPFYGGRFSVVPSADRRSPAFSLGVVRKVSLAKVPALLWHAARRREDPSGNVIYGEAGTVEITTPGIPIQMDGDAVGHTPAVFRKGSWRLPLIVAPP